MTIELSPAPAETKPSASSEAKNSKTSTSGAGKTGANAPGGFMAILASVDSDPVVAALDAEQGLPLGLNGALPTGLTDMNVVAETAELSMDATALLAQSSQWAPVQPTVGDAAVNGRSAFALQAQMQTQNRHFAGEAQDSSAGFASVRKPGKGLPDMSTNQSASGVGSATLAGANGHGQADGKALQFTPKMENIQMQFSASETAVTVASGPAGNETRTRDTSIFKPAAVEGAPASPQSLTSAPATLTYGESSAGVLPEVYVAEQIKYWISNDVQNAEMKLDGIGDNPVEVSISMQGNEAHVAFRTDELHAREALENASVHLKDLLQREGLVLSGVSVGTAGAGAGDSGAQERKARQGAKAGVVVTAQPVRADMAPASGRVSGRALDLFV